MFHFHNFQLNEANCISPTVTVYRAHGPLVLTAHSDHLSAKQTLISDKASTEAGHSPRK